MGKRRVFLIRVGIDSSYGGLVSPIFPDGDFIFTPIPDGDNDLPNKVNPKMSKYRELEYNGIPITDYLPKDRLSFNNHFISDPANINAHEDPEFKTNTYGELKQKRIYNTLKTFEPGDYVLFYSAFYPCESKKFKYCDYSLNDLQRIQRGKKTYYLFAYLELKYPLIDRSNVVLFEDEVRDNQHFRRGDFEAGDTSFILKGTEDSGILPKVKRIDKGRKGSNYQMTREFAQFKVSNSDKRGLNRSYCQLHDSVIEWMFN